MFRNKPCVWISEGGGALCGYGQYLREGDVEYVRRHAHKRALQSSAVRIGETAAVTSVVRDTKLSGNVTEV